MKQTTLAFIIALGLAVPGFAYAAKYDFTGWNDDGGINAARLAAQKSHFEYNRIYELDSAWNGSGQDASATRLAAQKSHFEYDKIYERDLAA